jgi:hypothetical protein
MEMLQNNTSSLQVMLIRQIQIAEGNTPCYATKCKHNRTPEECCWSYDCFPEQTNSNQVNSSQIAHSM